MKRVIADIQASRYALAGFVAIGAGWATFAAQMPAIKAQVGLADGHYGVLVLLGSIGAMMAMWLAPAVHRLFGRRSMAVGAVAMAAGFVIVGLAGSASVFTIGIFLAAAGSGVTDILANAEVSVRESETRRSLMNLNHGAFSATYGLAALLVAPVREAGWSPVLVFACLAGLVLCLLPALQGARARPDESDHAAPEGDDFPGAVVWLGGIIVLIAFLGEASAEGWSALHIERTIGGTPAQGALGPAILGLSMAVGRLGAHFFIAHVPPLRVITAACLCATAGLFLVSVAPGLGAVYLGFGLAGLGVSVIGPLALGLVGQSVPARHQLLAISRAAALGFGAFFIGPVLMGFVSEAFGLRFSFLVIGIIVFIAAAGVLPVWARSIVRT